MKNKKTTASFVSLGCFKNLVDTEVLGGLLKKRDIEIVSSYEDSDWLIINTCGFIRDAKEESIDEILAAIEKKEQGEHKHVAVFGCLTQRYLKDLKTEFDGVDILWGVNDPEQLADLIATGGKKEYKNSKPFLYNETHDRIITTTPNVSFIKISEGCNMSCSFCAIPSIRGPYRSREIASIVSEALRYREMGFQEINLISQNSTYFGKDRSNKSQLPLLLKELSSLGIPAIRVLYLMPEEVNDEIIDAFSHPTIIPYFDLPFQHVSQSVLKGMNRSGDFDQKMKLISKIRSRHYDAVLRASFIVGFPGETERDYEELQEFARESGIERIGVFGYSDEEGTSAFDLEDKLPEDVIAYRKEMLLDISDENLDKYNQSLQGTYQDFIPLAPWESDSTIGRVLSQAPDTDGLTRVGGAFDEDYTIQQIKITGSEKELLHGEKI